MRGKGVLALLFLISLFAEAGERSFIPGGQNLFDYSCSIGEGRWLTFSAQVPSQSWRDPKENPPPLPEVRVWLHGVHQAPVELTDPELRVQARESREILKAVLCQGSRVLLVWWHRPENTQDDYKDRDPWNCLYHFDLFSVERLKWAPVSSLTLQDFETVQLPKFAEGVPGSCIGERPLFVPLDLERGRLMYVDTFTRRTDWFAWEGRRSAEIDLFRSRVEISAEQSKKEDHGSQRESAARSIDPNQYRAPVLAWGPYFLTLDYLHPTFSAYGNWTSEIWDARRPGAPLLRNLSYQLWQITLDPMNHRVATFGQDSNYYKRFLHIWSFDPQSGRRTAILDLSGDSLGGMLGNEVHSMARSDHESILSMQLSADGGLYFVFRRWTFFKDYYRRPEAGPVQIARLDLRSRELKILGQHCSSHGPSEVLARELISPSSIGVGWRRFEHNRLRDANYSIDGTNPQGILIRSGECLEWWPSPVSDRPLQAPN